MKTAIRIVAVVFTAPVIALGLVFSWLAAELCLVAASPYFATKAVIRGFLGRRDAR